jgi:hypothetical protein
VEDKRIRQDLMEKHRLGDQGLKYQKRRERRRRRKQILVKRLNIKYREMH